MQMSVLAHLWPLSRELCLAARWLASELCGLTASCGSHGPRRGVVTNSILQRPSDCFRLGLVQAETASAAPVRQRGSSSRVVDRQLLATCQRRELDGAGSRH